MAFKRHHTICCTDLFTAQKNHNHIISEIIRYHYMVSICKKFFACYSSIFVQISGRMHFRMKSLLKNVTYSKIVPIMCVMKISASLIIHFIFFCVHWMCILHKHKIKPKNCMYNNNHSVISFLNKTVNIYNIQHLWCIYEKT